MGGAPEAPARISRRITRAATRLDAVGVCGINTFEYCPRASVQTHRSILHMGTPKKPTKTPRQLANMIASRMRIGEGSAIVIHPNKTLGWRAVVLAAPNMAARAQKTVDEIATELRAQFDLEE